MAPLFCGWRTNQLWAMLHRDLLVSVHSVGQMCLIGRASEVLLLSSVCQATACSSAGGNRDACGLFDIELVHPHICFAIMSLLAVLMRGAVTQQSSCSALCSL